MMVIPKTLPNAIENYCLYVDQDYTAAVGLNRLQVFACITHVDLNIFVIKRLKKVL